MGFHRFTAAFEGCSPGISFNIYSQSSQTLADLINVWNANAVKSMKHFLAMDADFTDSDNILLTNTSDFTYHLWLADGSHYYGAWMSGECRKVLISDIMFPITQYAQTSIPIIVSQDTVLFETTAYLYRRNNSKFYTKSEVLTAPAGFYKSPYALVATLNSCIQMRGERNGYIYNFIYDSTRGLLGVEATHRQPEPSTLQISHLSPYFTTTNTILPLRTAKRIYFEIPLPYIL